MGKTIKFALTLITILFFTEPNPLEGEQKQSLPVEGKI